MEGLVGQTELQALAQVLELVLQVVELGTQMWETLRALPWVGASVEASRSLEDIGSSSHLDYDA